MSKKNKHQINSEAAVKSEALWITDRAWLSGVITAACVVLAALWFSSNGVLTNGVHLGAKQITSTTVDSVLFALVLIIVVSSVCEGIRVFFFDKANYFCISPALDKKKYIQFFTRCFIKYLGSILLIFFIILFFETAGEYGFSKQAPFYQLWFRLLDVAWFVCIWLGLPYIVITQALHADKNHDTADLSSRSFLALANPINNAPLFFRTCLLRIVFAPLACVFFADNFMALVSGFDTISNRFLGEGGSGQYRHDDFNRDLVHISMSLILSIHMALAACGYLAMSPWQKNTIKSSDSSVLGWSVCLVCFPPFTMAIAWYFTMPSDREFLNLHNDMLVSVIGVILFALFSIYLSATICFGTRFSNLTHRGIIRTGPYRWVRHPAYSVYIGALWLTGLPVIIAALKPGGFASAAGLFIGLLIYTWIYYLRAITEEKHLSFDPQYRAYCLNTPRRFIPNVFRRISA